MIYCYTAISMNFTDPHSQTLKCMHICFHSYKIQKQAKLICAVRKEDSNYPGRKQGV